MWSDLSVHIVRHEGDELLKLFADYLDRVSDIMKQRGHAPSEQEFFLMRTEHHLMIRCIVPLLDHLSKGGVSRINTQAQQKHIYRMNVMISLAVVEQPGVFLIAAQNIQKIHKRPIFFIARSINVEEHAVNNVSAFVGGVFKKRLNGS